MKKVLFLLLVIAGIGFSQDAPTAYTDYYGFRLWAQGAQPSADSLNANWSDIDLVLNDLIVYADPRYFDWSANGDTLTLNTNTFGTIGFNTDENLYLPYHDPPYSSLGGGAVGYATGGNFVFNNSAASRVDTMASQYWVRNYLNTSFTETATGLEISGFSTVSGIMTVSGRITFSDNSGNLILPRHDSPYTNLTSGSIAQNDNGYIIYNNVSDGNEDTLTTFDYIRSNYNKESVFSVTSVSAADSIVSAVPSGYVLDKIIVEETGAAAVDIDLGTTSSGTQIKSSYTIPASSSAGIVLDTLITGDTNIYIGASTSWGSAVIDVYVISKKYK